MSIPSMLLSGAGLLAILLGALYLISVLAFGLVSLANYVIGELY